MKIQSLFTLGVITGAVCAANFSVCLAQDTAPVVPVTSAGDVAPAPMPEDGSYTTTTERKEVIKPHHEDHGLIPDTVGVTGKAVKETIGLPGKAVKETAKVLF